MLQGLVCLNSAPASGSFLSLGIHPSPFPKVCENSRDCSRRSPGFRDIKMQDIANGFTFAAINYLNFN